MIRLPGKTSPSSKSKTVYPWSVYKAMRVLQREKPVAMPCCISAMSNPLALVVGCFYAFWIGRTMVLTGCFIVKFWKGSL